MSWTGRLVKKEDALRRFVFSSSLQIMHVNGLTYDFLFAMAKELDQAKSLMLLGAGKSGKEPLILRRGAIPYRGFLEGRVSGDKYALLLHLSNLELKRPVVEAQAVAEEQATAASAPVQPEAPKPEKTPIARIVPAAPPQPAMSAKTELAGSVAKAKTGTRKKKQAETAEAATEASAPRKAARKPAAPAAGAKQ